VVKVVYLLSAAITTHSHIAELTARLMLVRYMVLVFETAVMMKKNIFKTLKEGRR